MSSLGDVLKATSALVDSLTAVCETQTFQALPSVAAELGAVELLDSAVDGLVPLLTSLDRELGKLEDSLEQLDGVIGLLGMIKPLIESLGRMLGEASEEFDSYGLQGAELVSGSIRQGFAYTSDAFQLIEAIDVGTPALSSLRASLRTFATKIYRLRSDVADDATLPASESKSEHGEAA